MRWLQLFIGLLCLSCVYAHINDYIIIPGLRVPLEYHTRVLEVDTWTDFFWANLYIGVFYYCVYLGVGTLLESSNPAPKTNYRKQMTKKQVELGISSLFWVILGTSSWMLFIEKHGPFYGYYSTHDFGIKEWIISLVVYAVSFDLWFYVTHILLHFPYLWKIVHKYHHEFVEPSAFGQDAVHPIEAIIQGPLGHFLPTLIYPMHPVWVNIFGFLTGIYAMFAHDARWDPVGHVNHHYYINCNYGLWGFLDNIFGTKYNKKDFPNEYIPTWKREQVK